MLGRMQIFQSEIAELRHKFILYELKFGVFSKGYLIKNLVHIFWKFLVTTNGKENSLALE